MLRIAPERLEIISSPAGSAPRQEHWKARRERIRFMEASHQSCRIACGLNSVAAIMPQAMRSSKRARTARLRFFR
jgi:hypothetical protein